MVSGVLPDDDAANTILIRGPENAGPLFDADKSALQGQPAPVEELGIQSRDDAPEITLRQAAPLVGMLTAAMVITVRSVYVLLLWRN